MKVLIVGTGTIGKPLIRLFLRMRKTLDFEEVIFHKNTPNLKDRGMLERFHHYGAKLAVYSRRMDEFTKLLVPHGLKPDFIFEQALEKADLVIDCTDKGTARALKRQYYSYLSNKLGFIAQGSEDGFGKPYAFGINDCALRPEEDKYIQVVSCNTHQGLCLLKTLVLDPEQKGEWRIDNLKEAELTFERRGADISQEEITIGPRIGTPTDKQFGTHQAADIVRTLMTVSPITLNISSVADITNQPFVHIARFKIVTAETVTLEEVENRFRLNPLTAVTYEEGSHKVFSIGRDEGHFGRILNQTVVFLPSLKVEGDGHVISGGCFTPQDGNPLLSSMAAALWFWDPSTYQQKIKKNFFKLPFIFDEV